MAFPFLGIFLLFLDAHNTKMPPFVCLPKASSFIITTGSLAVSVTDMTAPVVGSSGGVYALVSAHLANVVMVSFCVCACTGYVCVDDYHVTRFLSLYRALPHHQSRLFWDPAGGCSIYRCHTFLNITIGLSFFQRSESVCTLLCDSM